MELLTSKGIIIITIVIIICIAIYKIFQDRKACKHIFKQIQKDKGKAKKFEKELLHDLQKVFKKLQLIHTSKSRREKTLPYHEVNIYFYGISLVFTTNDWHYCCIKYKNKTLEFYPHEVNREEKIMNFLQPLVEW